MALQRQQQHPEKLEPPSTQPLSCHSRKRPKGVAKATGKAWARLGALRSEALSLIIGNPQAYPGWPLEATMLTTGWAIRGYYFDHGPALRRRTRRSVLLEERDSAVAPDSGPPGPPGSGPPGRCLRFQGAPRPTRFAGVVAMRRAAVLEHKEKGRFKLKSLRRRGRSHHRPGPAVDGRCRPA